MKGVACFASSTSVLSHPLIWRQVDQGSAFRVQHAREEQEEEDISWDQVLQRIDAGTPGAGVERQQEREAVRQATLQAAARARAEAEVEAQAVARLHQATPMRSIDTSPSTPQEGAGLTQRVFDQVPPSPPQDVAAAHPALEPPAPTELPTVPSSSAQLPQVAARAQQDSTAKQQKSPPPTSAQPLLGCTSQGPAILVLCIAVGLVAVLFGTARDPLGGIDGADTAATNNLGIEPAGEDLNSCNAALGRLQQELAASVAEIARLNKESQDCTSTPTVQCGEAAHLPGILFNQSRHSDVIFSFLGAPGVKMFANRQVVALASQELASLLGLGDSQDNAPSASASKLELPAAVEPAAMTLLLEHIYTGMLPSPAALAVVFQAYAAAHRFHLQKLSDHLAGVALKGITADTAASFLTLLHKQDGGGSELHDKMMLYIVEHKEEVVKSNGFEALSSHPNLLLAVAKALA